jgi:hypothetical protein
MTQAVRRWLLIVEARVQSRVTSYEIHIGRKGTKADFLPVLSFTFIPSYSSITAPLGV